MSIQDLCFAGVKALSEWIRRREISPVELVRACLERMETHNPKVNAFITMLPDEALSRAREAEQEIRQGDYRGPLHGIPFGLKDLFMVQGRRFTLGSRLFDDHMAPMDSTVARRLRQAGAVLVGKQNMNPLAYGPFATESGYDYGHSYTPWDVTRMSGGSSGGSAVAVSAGFCPVSVGSDTGGSVRIPGAWCGVAALKPTYGRISRHGMQALAWSLDHPGILARRVEDCAMVMQAISGYDSNDPSSARVPVPDFKTVLHPGIKGVKIGLPVEYGTFPVDPEVRQWVEKALQVLVDLGAEPVELNWPMLAYAENMSNIILLSEASSIHEQLVKKRGHELWPSLRLRLEAGLLLPAADYLRAQRARTRLLQETTRLFDKVDVIVGPSMPVTASLPGQAMVPVGTQRIGLVRAMTQFNDVFNLTGHPALSIPCGFSRTGLPIGLQLAGRPFEEPLVLQIGRAFEDATGFWKPVPDL